MRDHSLIQIDGAVDENGAWHRDLCYTFVSLYKRYLQTLGFSPLVIDNFPKKYIERFVFNFHYNFCGLQRWQQIRSFPARFDFIHKKSYIGRYITFYCTVGRTVRYNEVVCD